MRKIALFYGTGDGDESFKKLLYGFMYIVKGNFFVA